MAGGMELPDEGVRRSSADREALREALLDGSLSPAEVADLWPTGDRQAALIRSAFDRFEEWGYDTGRSRGGDVASVADGTVACDAAIERAREAVDGLGGGQVAEREHPNPPAPSRIADATRGVDLDLDGGAW